MKLMRQNLKIFANFKVLDYKIVNQKINHLQSKYESGLII